MACVWDFKFLWQTTQFCRALALQALVDHLSKNWCGFGLKVPISLNWVKFRPGIWDGGATSSTGCGAWDRSPTHGCLGLAPMRGLKQCGIDILPIFLLRFGSNLWMCMASLASWVTWEESLSIMLKFSIEDKGWWKSVQCLSMADMFDLECSLTLSPRDLDVSPTYEELQLSAWHSQWYTMSFFWLVGTLSLGCISRDLRLLTPLKQTCTAMY